jgi:hypothetical protein
MRSTTVLGFNMQGQQSRRRLVIAVYALLAAAMVAGWFLDRFRATGSIYVYFVALFINWKIFGGYGTAGLVKPFTGKGPRNQPMPSDLVELALYSTGSLPSTLAPEYRNDEREVARRDRVHYQAYQVIAILLCPIWFIAHWELHPRRFVPAGLLPILLYCIALPAILLAVTLPQAIILWTEPDSIAELDAETAPAGLKSTP